MQWPWKKRAVKPTSKLLVPYGEDALERMDAGLLIAQKLPEIPSAKQICLVHKVMFDGVQPRAGAMREGNQAVAIGAFETAPAHRIGREFGLLEAQMKDLPDKTLEERSLRLAFYHLRFEAIHPFRDGNGRVGRALAQNQAVKWLGAEQDFAMRMLEDKEAYFGAFEASYPKGKGRGALDIAPMANIVMKSAGHKPNITAVRARFRIPPFETLDARETEYCLPPFPSELEASIITGDDKNPFPEQPSFESHGYER